MKVLMFGWEFPPFKSGGLGTACMDLTKGLARNGVDVTFVMPNMPEGAEAEYVKLIGANNLAKHIKIKGIKTILTPYQTSEDYDSALLRIPLQGTSGKQNLYGKDMYEEVGRYSQAAKLIAEQEDHDVIHVHDWMTYHAGINAKEVSGKPLVAHIHATEFDRTGGNPNSHISHLEYEGLNAADIVIANSHYTKQNVINAYNINPKKIEVVHWGIDPDLEHFNTCHRHLSPFKNGEKVVLFLGRITIQKGPDYFIEAARLVKDYVPEAKFIFAGSGDMMPRIIERAADLGLSNDVIFTGFLKGEEVHKAFQFADLYVMPSVSEPFGLVALEALKNNTPILISKQSGVSEVLSQVLKTDFWDVNAMADKIINTLRCDTLHGELRSNGFAEAQTFNLDTPAQKTMLLYNKAMMM
ncbi:glycosyltransferase family 4 protein [Candidatus Woesearchaeota archaeon]|nr:glycosyltransferase family 4 protein [Candidatus Woesearchaeota archaeon]